MTRRAVPPRARRQALLGFQHWGDASAGEAEARRVWVATNDAHSCRKLFPSYMRLERVLLDALVAAQSSSRP